MPLEEPRLRCEAGVEIVTRKTGHDLEQNCDVIFRLTRRSSALNSQDVEIFTDARERSLVQRYSDQPFVLLGVNGEGSPEELGAVDVRPGMTVCYFFTSGQREASSG